MVRSPAATRTREGVTFDTFLQVARNSGPVWDGLSPSDAEHASLGQRRGKRPGEGYGVGGRSGTRYRASAHAGEAFHAAAGPRATAGFDWGGSGLSGPAGVAHQRVAWLGRRRVHCPVRSEERRVRKEGRWRV